jgi:hypothetical protein
MTKCLRCSCDLEFEVPQTSLATGAYCPGCVEALALEERGARARAVKDNRWERVCPERYRDTVVEKLPYLDCSQRALKWRPDSGTGLNLWGYPDTGKTRTMLLVLHEALRRGKTVRLFEAGQFAEACESVAWSSAALSKALVAVDVLAFDDMDKLTLTRHQEMLFFGVVDRRMTRRLPTVFTHNATAAELEYRFRCGESLVRRLRQFYLSVHFPPRKRSLEQPDLPL